jgi:hypothetical protein
VVSSGRLSPEGELFGQSAMLSWSLTGWPSKQNEFDERSPSPCISPLLSVVTPGAVSVTSELNDEEGPSKGSLSNSS